MSRPRRPLRIRMLARLAVLLVAAATLGSCVPSVFGRRRAYVPLEHQMFALVNKHRVEMRLPPLVYDPVVSEIAREHSRRMAKQTLPFGHRGFRARAREVRSRMEVETVSENVAVNTFTPQASPVMAMKGFLGSRKHRRNIEGPYRLTGIGVARGANGSYYYTQLFVR